MPRKKALTLSEVIEIGKQAGVDEIQIGEIRVKFRLPNEEILPSDEVPADEKFDEMKILLHSSGMSDEEIKRYTDGR